MSKSGRKKKKLWQKILIALGCIIGALLLIVAAFLGWLSANEYRPADEEVVDIDTSFASGEALTDGSSLSIMTWNVGYGTLGDNADFFMDGGNNVITASPERMEVNLAGIEGIISSMSPDILFLQELDRDSKRSYFTDEMEEISTRVRELPEITGGDADKGKYISSFAYNFKTKYVPYPASDPIGKVECGIATFSRYSVDEAKRVSLPCPFSWPIRTVNLKRCLLINRIPVKDKNGNDSGKELVLVNLHLEAYDDGEGKEAQTEIMRGILQDEYDKGNYVIAGGDFNQVFSNVDMSSYPVYEGSWVCGLIETGDFGDDWQFEMDNRVPTCRNLDKPYQGADKDSFQYYMIDGFIVSGNVRVDSVMTQDFQFAASDHNPVLMTVTLGQETD